jgi:hypothetical protein
MLFVQADTEPLLTYPGGFEGPLRAHVNGEERSAQNSLISRFNKMVSAIDSTIDQSRQPGRKPTCARSPDLFQITNIAHQLQGRAYQRESRPKPR